MTPKEKAKELYYKYFSMIKIESPIDRVSSIPYVKKCALIAVDEILNTLDKNLDSSQFSVMNYWNDVKEEIENL
jgi:hypothetical protein